MLRDFGMEDCTPVKTPIVPGLCLEKPGSEEIEFMKDRPYTCMPLANSLG